MGMYNEFMDLYSLIKLATDDKYLSSKKYLFASVVYTDLISGYLSETQHTYLHTTTGYKTVSIINSRYSKEGTATFP